MYEELELPLFRIGLIYHWLQTWFSCKDGKRWGREGDKRAFSWWISEVSLHAALSQSISKSGIWVIKDFSRRGILEIGTESQLSMLTDRKAPMKLCFTLIYCIILFDREQFLVTVAGQCVFIHAAQRQCITAGLSGGTTTVWELCPITVCLIGSSVIWLCIHGLHICLWLTV